MTRMRRYAPTTLGAMLLIAALTLVFAAFGLNQIRTSSQSQASRASLLGLASQEAATGRTIAGGLTLAVCALTASLALGIARRQQGSRYAGIGVFLLLGCLSLASSLAGFSADPPAPNAGMGMLNAVACFAILALLLAPRTARDFERGEMDRRLHSRAGRPA